MDFNVSHEEQNPKIILPMVPSSLSLPTKLKWEFSLWIGSDNIYLTYTDMYFLGIEVMKF